MVVHKKAQLLQIFMHYLPDYSQSLQQE